MPSFTGTTGSANLCIVGDFGKYVVAQRAGFAVERVDHLFDTTTGMPTSQRGYSDGQGWEPGALTTWPSAC